METIDRHTRLPQKLALLFSLPPAVALVAFAVDVTVGGGGHPPLGAGLVSWVLYPTLTGYLSRAFLGSDFFPSYFLMLLGLMEYPLVGFGLGSVVARAKLWTDLRIRVGLVALLSYISVQVAAHLLLNLAIVNVRLVSHANPAVSVAAIDRIRASGDLAALPFLQQQAVEELQQHGFFKRDTLLDALTQLGGAKGWQDLLESERLTAAGQNARAWRSIIQNVREMTNPLYADARGGVTSPYLRDEDIARLFDALALKLAGRLEQTPDSEASLTLLDLMKERPDLCAKYLGTVPNGLRGPISQATLEIVEHLAAMKRGRRSDDASNDQPLLSREERIRIGREQTLVAEEWAAWAKAGVSACSSP